MKTERFEMRLDQPTIEKIDQWRAKQPMLPSRAESVRQLLYVGLRALTDDELMPTPSEKLILCMLCDIAVNKGGSEHIDPDFVQKAISGGHFWAIEQQYHYIFGGRPDSPELVREVKEILDMWQVIECHYKSLGEADKKHVESEVGPYANDVKFTGFYANEESRHLVIAELLVKTIGNYSHFKDHNLSAKYPVIDWYRRMLHIYEPMLRSILSGPKRSLSASDIVALLREQIHPDNRG